LEEITAGIDADLLLTGHTHLPFMRQYRNLLIVNPGSVGQPLDGDPRAAYAVWEDGRVSLHRVLYDQTHCLNALLRLSLSAPIRDQLTATLRAGRIC
jgi:predicted phosphodiesterase